MVIMAVEKLVFLTIARLMLFDIIFDDFKGTLGDTRFPRVLFHGERYPNFIDFGQ